jgi:hypothetical protein
MAIHTFECSCCKLPFARIQNGALVIDSRHHGERHTNVIALAELVRLVPVAEMQRLLHNSVRDQSSAESSKSTDSNCGMVRSRVE